MINRRLEDVDETSLRALIADAEAESMTMEFKQELPGRDNAARHEFCADICAFANAQGGDMIFALSEDGEGRALDLQPLPDNADEACLRLQDMAFNGLEPRVTGIHVRAVVVPGGYAFIVRVPRSWHAPHRVKTNQHFYVREGRRKRQLDMPEVSAAFARSTGAVDQIRSFRADRIGRILAGESPIRLFDGVIAVLHVVPLQPENESAVDPRVYQMERRLPVMSGAQGLDFRLNLDGGFSHRPATERGCGAYTLIFRDGKVEAARVFNTDLGNGVLNVPSRAYEQELLAFLTAMLPDLLRLRLGPPFVIMYSLLRAGNACLGVGHTEERWFEGDRHFHFDRDTLLYPEVILEQIDELDISLKPMFDLVWQSVGQPNSLNYDANGRWVGR
jgi:hypothetical protein